MFKRKKVGLALGSGGARGLAHIGVLKVLEKYNIPVDLVSGTSMGSVIGALYCSGMNSEQLEKEALSTSWKSLIDLTLPKSGLLKGNKIEQHIRRKINNSKFKDLKKPFFVSAVDIKNYNEVIFNKGDVARAVRASISIPGVFNPVENNSRILVDGGLVDPMPVDILKRNGADIIIAVNVSAIKKGIPPVIDTVNSKNSNKTTNIANVILRSFLIIESEGAKAILDRVRANLIIAPDLHTYKTSDFHKAKELIEIGEITALQELKKIEKLAKPSFFKRFFG